MLTNSLFARAEQDWNLDEIYRAVIELKIKDNKAKDLSNREKIILSSLLCSYHPDIIARQLPGASYEENLDRAWEIYDYLQKIALEKLKLADNTSYDLSSLISFLSATEFKKNNSISKTGDKDLHLDGSFTGQIISSRDKEAINTKTNASFEIKSSSKPNIATVTRKNELQTNSYVSKEKQPQSGAIVPRDWQVLDTDIDRFPTLNRWNTIGGMVIIGSIGIAAILAATIKYDVVVRAEGTIRPEGETKLVQATREGKIKDIRVKENQVVKRGQIIASLDDSELRGELKQMTDDIQQSQLELIQLQEIINTLEVQIAIEAVKGDRIIDSTAAQLEQAQTKRQQEQLTTQAQVVEAVAQLNIARRELAKAQTELQSFEASLNSTKAALVAATSKRDRYQKILNSGAISQEQFEEVQLAVQKEAENLKSQQASLLGQKQTIEGQKQQVEVAKAQLSRARTTANIDDTEIAIAEQAIEREKATKNSTVTSYIRQKQELLQQKIELEKQITQKKQQAKQLNKNIEQSLLKATADGKILELNLRNQNQVVNPQDTITQIVPDTASLLIKAKIEPKDRQRIDVGQSAKLKINACPYPDYGVLAGTVTNISADTITSSDNQQTYYTADIFPAAPSLVQNNQTCQLESGMSVNANIITKAETPLQFLLRQSRLIVDRG